MCFYGEEDDIHPTNFFERTGNRGSRDEVAFAALYLHSAVLHGAKMRTSGEQSDIKASFGHTRADVGSDCAGARDQEFHPSLSTVAAGSRSAAATARRRIFPVAVVGILFTR